MIKNVFLCIGAGVAFVLFLFIIVILAASLVMFFLFEFYHMNDGVYLGVV